MISDKNSTIGGEVSITSIFLSKYKEKSFFFLLLNLVSLTYKPFSPKNAKLKNLVGMFNQMPYRLPLFLFFITNVRPIHGSRPTQGRVFLCGDVCVYERARSEVLGGYAAKTTA